LKGRRATAPHANTATHTNTAAHAAEGTQATARARVTATHTSTAAHAAATAAEGTQATIVFALGPVFSAFDVLLPPSAIPTLLLGGIRAWAFSSAFFFLHVSSETNSR